MQVYQACSPVGNLVSACDLEGGFGGVPVQPWCSQALHVSCVILTRTSLQITIFLIHCGQQLGNVGHHAL